MKIQIMTEKFWEDVYNEAEDGGGIITSRTLKTGFHVSAGMKYIIQKNGKTIKINPEIISRPGYSANKVMIDFSPSDEIIAHQICFGSVFT